MAHGSASLTVGEVGDGAAVTSGSGVRVATGLSQPAGGDDEALAGSSRGRAKGGDEAGGGGQECAFLERHGGASADVGGAPTGWPGPGPGAADVTQIRVVAAAAGPWMGGPGAPQSPQAHGRGRRDGNRR